LLTISSNQLIMRRFSKNISNHHTTKQNKTKQNKTKQNKNKKSKNKTHGQVIGHIVKLFKVKTSPSSSFHGYHHQISLYNIQLCIFKLISNNY
jgi:flagellar basal body rod protein FlgC